MRKLKDNTQTGRKFQQHTPDKGHVTGIYKEPYNSIKERNHPTQNRQNICTENHKKRYSNGQQTHKKILNIITH